MTMSTPNPGLILVRGGRLLRPFEMTASDIDLEDIAYGLAHTFRWASRSDWTVAEHCLMVARHVPAEHRLAALLHDAEEAFPPGDVASPTKVLPECEALRARGCQIRHLILRKYGLPPELPEAVRVADLRALATERRDLMPMRPEGVVFPDDVWTPFDEVVRPSLDLRGIAEDWVWAIENALIARTAAPE
jgi:uncharacterized protein